MRCSESSAHTIGSMSRDKYLSCSSLQRSNHAKVMGLSEASEPSACGDSGSHRSFRFVWKPDESSPPPCANAEGIVKARQNATAAAAPAKRIAFIKIALTCPE